ncbi:Transcription factor Dp-1, partial [Gryllus bimaculatus]
MKSYGRRCFGREEPHCLSAWDSPLQRSIEFVLLDRLSAVCLSRTKYNLGCNFSLNILQQILFLAISLRRICEPENERVSLALGTAQVVTIPIQSAPGTMKVSTLKTAEPTLLPKIRHMTSDSVVLNSSQRLTPPQQNQVIQNNPPKNYISPILDHSGSRKRQEVENDFMPE